ncbi:NTP transferase domain-containing protein [Patescibacteria group bacterium]|nr:NTP transferase domain-containing protein [Patescibacteria group bacterium]
MKLKKELKKFLIRENTAIKQAMRRLDQTGEKILFIIDKSDKLIGSLSDGNIRRWILSGGTIKTTINKIFNKKPITVTRNFSQKKIKGIMLGKRISCIPVTDKEGNILDLCFWDHIFSLKKIPRFIKPIKIPVVIMAGGKGTRLDPFTRILPKPLIPIGNRTLIEFVIEKFRKHGINVFYLSINYKAGIIKSYFEEIKPRYQVHYLAEKKPLGTVGSLVQLKKEKLGAHVFVCNCDTIIDADYAEILDFHKKGRYDVTLVASLKYHQIPYGVCELTKDGSFSRIKEKPEFDFLVNTGFYILKTEAIKHIPRDKFFNITDLIKKLDKERKRIGVFPISDKLWLDAGEWQNYQETIKLLS